MDANSLHATAVAAAVDADGPLAGVLMIGPSGAGKSSLALSLLETCPFGRTALVADDFVRLTGESGRLIARSPDRIAGLIEIRGFGPVCVRHVAACAVVLAIDLGAACERSPAPSRFGAGADSPGVPLYPFMWKAAEASAPHRLRRMIASILGGQNFQRTQDKRPAQTPEDG